MEGSHFSATGTSYCSLGRGSVPHITTLKQGLDLIIHILSKDLLCHHDIENINQIYQEMDLLERRFGQVSPDGTMTVFKKINERVVKIAVKMGKDQELPPGDLVTLYHFTFLTCEQLPLKDVFKAYMKRLDRGRPPVDKMAFAIPFCSSEKVFMECVTELVGPLPVVSASPSETPKKGLEERKAQKEEEKKRLKFEHEVRLAHKYMEEKKAAFGQVEEKRKQLNSRVAELPQLQKKSPEKYPSYLMELIENGFLALFDHLVTMQTIEAIVDRSQYILDKLSFHEAAKVILETREAILQKVRSSIPKEIKKVAIFTGGSGVGKSTSLCFIRGDKMTLNRESQYESASDSKTIGHNDKLSCTFLPNMEIIGDLAIIDYPGFDDTNGPLVSLGMELALKALIKIYHPKILVFESITNTEGRYQAVARLAARLNRIMGSKANCLLGITKYAQNRSVIELKKLEEEERRARSVKTPKEIELESQIALFAQLIAQTPVLEAALKPQQEAKEIELRQIQEEKAKAQGGSLPETEEKRRLRQKVKEVEENIKKETGLTDLVPFSDLDDARCLEGCLDKLAQPTLVDDSLGSFLRFDADHKRLVDELFKLKLVPKLDEKNFDTNDERFNNFERKVLETSLIFTLTQDDSPEIGSLLHLAEVDPTMVREYDQQIVEKFNKKYTQQVIGGFNMGVVRTLIAECRRPENQERYKETAQTLARIETKLEKLQAYIMGLLGRNPDNQKDRDREWTAIQDEYQSIEQDNRFPLWGEILLGVPLGIPFGIYWWWKSRKTTREQLTYMQDKADDYERTIDSLTKVLVKLKNLENQIKKRSAIDEDFHKRPILLDSNESVVQSVRGRIEAVRIKYGSVDWDERVERLVQELFPKRFFASRDVFHEWEEINKLEGIVDQLMPYHLEMILASLFDPEIVWRVVKRGSDDSRHTTEQLYCFKNFLFQERSEESSLSPRSGKELDMASLQGVGDLLEVGLISRKRSMTRSKEVTPSLKEMMRQAVSSLFPPMIPINRESSSLLSWAGTLASGVKNLPGAVLGAATGSKGEETSEKKPSIYTQLVRLEDGLQYENIMYAADLSQPLMEAWNELILPRLSELIEARTPINLALLGAVLLKKWGQK